MQSCAVTQVNNLFGFQRKNNDPAWECWGSIYIGEFKRLLLKISLKCSTHRAVEMLEEEWRAFQGVNNLSKGTDVS